MPSPARRMGLWACALALCGLWQAARLVWPIQKASAPAQPVCRNLVAIHGPRGPVVGCGDDRAFAHLPTLEHGDAISDTSPRAVLPQQMTDPTRLGLGLPINVNQAEAQVLALMPGISPRLAAELVAHRGTHGCFTSVQQLTCVRGLGPATLKKVGPNLFCGPCGAGQAPRASVIAPDVKREWLVDVVARLPQGSVSRAWGWLARLERPRAFVALFKTVFARAVGIELGDAAAPDMGAYPSLQALFVRRLAPGARPVDLDPAAVVSPVDALCGVTGTISDGTLLQIKGRAYSLARLLGDPEQAQRFEGGTFATLYLAPRDYHRIHAPVSGLVREARLIPGALMPVFEESLNKVDELFARNERIITYLDTPNHGRVAVVKVGATLVGCIKVDYDVTLVGNRRDNTNRRVLYDSPKAIDKGGDLGVFELGSTVVVLAERGQMDLTPLRFGERVFVGRRIGTLTPLGASQNTGPEESAPRP